MADQAPTSSPACQVADALRSAIGAKVLISARYNVGVSILAPYATFVKHGEAYLRAVTVARDGVEPAQLKLGTFKLSGLGNVQVTSVPFDPTELYRRVEARAPRR